MKKKLVTYSPHTSTMTEYLKDIDNLDHFEFIISEGSKDLVESYSNYLLYPGEKDSELDPEVITFAKGTKAKSKYLMHFIRKQFFIFYVHLFEYFLLKLVRETYETDIRSLKSCNKTVLVKDMVTALEEGRPSDALIDVEIGELSRGSYEDISNYFEKHFKIKLSASGANDGKIIELFQLRHAIVHNNGIIDRKFIEKVKMKKYIEGKGVYLDRRNLDQARKLFMRVARYADSAFYEKFDKSKKPS